MAPLHVPTGPVLRTRGGWLSRLQLPIPRISINWKLVSLVLVLTAGYLLPQPSAAVHVKNFRRFLFLNMMGSLSSPGVALIEEAKVADPPKAPFQTELCSEDLEATLFSDEAVQRQLWDLDGRYIVGIVLLLFQTLLIFGLVRHRARRRTTETEMRLSNDRLRRAVEAGRCVGWDWDVKTGNDCWFGDLEGLFGIRSFSYYGHLEDFIQRIHPEDRELAWKAVADARDGRKSFDAEFRVLRLDGTVRWITQRGQFYYAADGEAERMIGMAVDITERKLAEEALKKSEEKFSKAFRQSPLTLTVTTLKDHRYLDVNESFEQISGWRRDEVIGRTPFDLNLWVDPAQEARMVKELQANRTVRNLEIAFRSKSGEMRMGLGSAELIEIAAEPCVFSVLADITEHKQIQEQLQISQTRLAGMVGSAMDAIIATDAERNIVLFNAAAEKVFGCPAEEAIGTTIDRFTPERFRLARKEQMLLFGVEKVAKRDVNQRGILFGLRTNGEEFPMEASISHLEANGQHLFTVVARDVTERYRSDEALRKSEQRLRLAVQAGRMYADEWDVATNTIVRSPEYVDILGPDQPLQTSRLEELDRMYPQDRELVTGELARITPAKPSLTICYRFTRFDGNTIWLEKSVKGFFDDQGKLLRLVGVVADISDRKKTEQAHRESEERFRLVANTVPVLIWMSGADKQSTYFNHPWLEFTGRPLEAELGRGWIEGVHPEDLNACLDACTRAFDRWERFEIQYRLRRHDGKYRWVSDIGVPRFNADGSFAGFIGSCIDITDRKIAEEELTNMGRKLIEAHEEERTWIGRELHDDINQRIALLTIELDRWNQTAGSSSDIHGHIRKISQRLVEIGEDIQALSHRLHSSKLEYLGITIAAQSFCRELSERYKVQISFSHFEIPRNLPKEIALCLFRVLQEALQNAVKHSGVQDFKVELRGKTGEIHLSVIDAGSGFDSRDSLNRLGVGLISMRQRLQLVNGELSIVSEPGRGTAIYARVPVSREEGHRLKAG